MDCRFYTSISTRPSFHVFLSHHVQAVNIVIQCFKERLGSFAKKEGVFSQKGASMGRVLCRGMPQPTLPVTWRLCHFGYAAGAGPGLKIHGIGVHWLEFLHLKKEANQKHSQSLVG